jgi:hypothetical protein
MGANIKSINLDNAKEGMILLEDVLNDRGDIFLKKGTVLTQSLIDRLKSSGASEISVENTEETKIQESVPPSVAKQIEELESRFSDVRGDVIMGEVLAAVKEYITERGIRDGKS